MATWIGFVLIMTVLLVMLFDQLSGRRHRHLQHSKELWKSYALALEVESECFLEYLEEIAGEGCRTRSRRRDVIFKQLQNADFAADIALAKLVELGEYDE